MAGECQQITDQNQWSTVRTGDIVKAQFPCIFASVIEIPWYTRECRATSCFSCSATLGKQYPRFHSNYKANRRFPGTRHARFLHPSSEQARNVRRSFRRYRSSWLKKYTWASRGIELYPQNGGQAAVVDAWGFTAYGGFDGARCPFSTFFASPRWSPLRKRAKVVSFFIFFQKLSNNKKWHFSAVDYRNRIALRGGILTWVKRDQIKMASFLIGALHVRPVQCMVPVCMNFSRTVWRWAFFCFFVTSFDLVTGQFPFFLLFVRPNHPMANHQFSFSLSFCKNWCWFL